MIKKIFVLAWFLLIGSIIASVVTGSLTELGMVVLGIIGLGLVYTFALWAVIINPEGEKQLTS